MEGAEAGVAVSRGAESAGVVLLAVVAAAEGAGSRWG
jgi:hypothetical protein